MGFWGVANILLVTGLLFILFFSYNSARQDNEVDTGEFVKLSGILILLSALCVIFLEITFAVIQAFSWVFIYLLTVLKSDIFTMQVGYLITLLLVNVGGAYMLWEQHKEKKEEEKFKAESEVSNKTSSGVQVADPAPTEEAPVSAEDNSTAASEEETAEYELSSKLSLSHRVAKILSEAGIETIEALTANTELQLSETKNLGEKSLEEIKNALQSLGLSLKAE